MTQSGGSAAIFGFLYQILANLARVAEITMTATVRDEAVLKATMCLEPLGGGGDAQYDVQGVRIVEQYKASGRNWSIRSFVDRGLHDLTLAVDSEDSRPSRYIFVTDAGFGHRGEFREFLRRLRAIEHDADPHLILDDVTERRYGRQLVLSDRALLAWLEQRLRQAISQRARQDPRLRTRLVKCLRGLEFECNLRVEQLEAEVDEFLRRRVDSVEDVKSKRDQLCTILMRHVRRSEATITPAELLSEAGIVARDLEDNAGIFSRCSGRLRRQLAWLRYDPALEVRAPIEADAAALFITGASGTGKSWALAQHAINQLRAGQRCVLLESSGDGPQDLQTVADEVWTKWLEHTAPTSFASFVTYAEPAWSKGVDPWLTILVDDVQSADVARHLLRASFDHPGIRLVLGVPTHIAVALAEDVPEAPQVFQVGEFTIPEIRKYFGLRDRRWEDLPTDVRALVQRPILARLYFESSPGPGWHPRSEYEIMERAWHRLGSAGSQAEHPGDRAILKDLAWSLVSDSTASYPWPVGTARRFGLDDEVFARLERVGWLRRTPADRIEVSHQRLLAWVIAESLLDALRSGAAEEELIVQVVVRLASPTDDPVAQGLDYVPMDFLWLATEQESLSRERVAEVLMHLERMGDGQGSLRALYERQIATLGVRIADALLARLERCDDGPEGEYYYHTISASLCQIARLDPVGVRGLVRRLFGSADDRMRALAVSLLRSAPDPTCLDLAWEHHKALTSTLQRPREERDYLGYSRSAAALRACAREAPDWIHAKVESAEPGSEPVHELVWLLLALDANTAHSLWLELREALMAKVSRDKPRVLCEAIGRFRDTGFEEFLREHVGSSVDGAASSAFVALARVNPPAAVELLPNAGADHLYMARHRWLPQLTTSLPRELGTALEGMADSEEFGWRWIALIYQGNEDLAPAELVQAVAARLERNLASLEGKDGRSEHRLDHAIRFLAKISEPAQLNALRSFRGQPLEQWVLAVALRHAETGTRSHDHTLEACRALLLRLEGSGFTDLVNAELASSEYWVRYGGLKWSSARADAATMRRLRQLACAPEPGPEHDYDRFRALECLAALGQVASVLDAIRVRTDSVPASLVRLLGSRRATPERQVEDAIADVESTDESRTMRGLLLMWISRNGRFAPRVLQLLRRLDPDSHLVRMAAETLHTLGGIGSSQIPELRAMLSGTNRSIALQALASLGSREAMDAIASALEGRVEDPMEDWDLDVWATLWTSDDHRDLVQSQLRQRYAPRLDVRGVAYPMLASMPDSDLHEILYRQAFAETSVVVGRVSRAAEALASFDPEAAMEAGLRAMKAFPAERLQAARVALGASAGRVAALVGAVLQDERAAVRNALGRATRTGPHAREVRSHVLAALEDTRGDVRRGACEIGGWMPKSETDFLEQAIGDLAVEDADEDVRAAAQVAVGRIRAHKWAARTLDEIGGSDVTRQWNLALLLLDRVDPFLLRSSKDALGMARDITAIGPAWLMHVRQKLKGAQDRARSKERQEDEKRARR